MCIEGAVHEKNNNYSEALKNYNNSLLCLKYVEELTDKINSFHLDSHPSLTFRNQLFFYFSPFVLPEIPLISEEPLEESRNLGIRRESIL